MVRWKKGTGKEQGYAEDPADQCGGDSGDAFYHAVLPQARWDVGVSQDGGFARVRAAGAFGAAAHGDERVRRAGRRRADARDAGRSAAGAAVSGAEAASFLLRGGLGLVFPGARGVYRGDLDALPAGVDICDPHCCCGARRGQLLRLCQGGAGREGHAARRGVYRERAVYDGLRGDGRVHQLEPGAVSVLRRRRMLLSERQYAGRALLRERRQPVPQRRPARAVLHGPDLHRPDDRVCVKRAEVRLLENIFFFCFILKLF